MMGGFVAMIIGIPLVLIHNLWGSTLEVTVSILVWITFFKGVVPQNQVASKLDMNTPAVRMAVHRARRRFRKALRTEVADTVAASEDIDGELRHLISALRP